MCIPRVSCGTYLQAMSLGHEEIQLLSSWDWSWGARFRQIRVVEFPFELQTQGLRGEPENPLHNMYVWIQRESVDVNCGRVKILYRVIHTIHTTIGLVYSIQFSHSDIRQAAQVPALSWGVGRPRGGRDWGWWGINQSGVDLFDSSSTHKTLSLRLNPKYVRSWD
jgi:hypothetical protein